MYRMNIEQKQHEINGHKNRMKQIREQNSGHSQQLISSLIYYT